MVTKRRTKTKKEISKKSTKKDEIMEDSIVIENLPKSVLIEEDLKRLEGKDKGSISVTHEKEIPMFYKKYVFKCMKCIKEFDHRVYIPSIRQDVRCPICGERHTINMTPVSGEYKVKFSKNLRVSKSKEKGQK